MTASALAWNDATLEGNRGSVVVGRRNDRAVLTRRIRLVAHNPPPAHLGPHPRSHFAPWQVCSMVCESEHDSMHVRCPQPLRLPSSPFSRTNTSKVSKR